ncbi:MAG: hypothetical protein KJ950_12325 [Proteobacteria bacterium]|nr:hypothetical protein [Pseudomonadota bacterium]MBU1687609.1 hypothetical protein [Pseudomonadota bacterium]
MVTTATRTNIDVRDTDSYDVLTKVSLFTMAAFSGMVGLWAGACFVGAVVSNGPGALAQGLVAALIG